MRPLLMFFVCIAQLSANVLFACADTNDIQTNGYTTARLDHICERIQEIYRLRSSVDIGHQVEMLSDSEPWVRAYVFKRLVEDTSFLVAWRKGAFADLDPWSEPASRTNDLVRFLQGMQRTQGALHYRDGLPSQVRERSKQLTVQEALDRLLDLATCELAYNARREAVPLLDALLDVQYPTIQARALQSLVAGMGFPHTLEDVKKLRRRNTVDSAFLAQKKVEWRAWWETNQSTYVLQKRPHTRPY